MRRGQTWVVGLAIATVSCNSLLGIDEASEVGSDASAGGNAGSGGGAGSDGGGAPGGGGVPSGGSAGTASGGVAGSPSGGGSAGAAAGGGTGGGAGGTTPCSTDTCPFDKIECCQSTNVSSALAVGNSIQTEVCEADQFTCAVCRQGGGACSAFCQNVGSEFAVCLDCIIENCSGLYVGVKAACGSGCSDFDGCMAGCGS